MPIQLEQEQPLGKLKNQNTKLYEHHNYYYVNNTLNYDFYIRYINQRSNTKTEKKSILSI